MKKKYITIKTINEFQDYLNFEEKSQSTIDKYIHDVKVFMKFINQSEVTKKVAIEYKQYLQEHYAIRSVNSMLASLNSLFAFLNWHEFKVKSLKLQQQVF